MLNVDMKKMNAKEMNWAAVISESDRHAESVSASGVCSPPLVDALLEHLGLRFPADGLLTCLVFNPTLCLTDLLQFTLLIGLPVLSPAMDNPTSAFYKTIKIEYSQVSVYFQSHCLWQKPSSVLSVRLNTLLLILYSNSVCFSKKKKTKVIIPV